MEKKKKTYEEDDDRVIADMNVEGMPWYVPRKKDEKTQEPVYTSPKETRSLIGGVLGAALLVAGIFALVYFLFLTFCDKLWLV